jgi:ketosteroid isomerase-like protein
MDQTLENFLADYARRINTHQFALVAPLISEEAVFWFTDGSFYERDSIQRAFERTWAVIQEETYRIDDVKWLSRDAQTAACVYTFHWQGLIDGAIHKGSGRGTTVLRKVKEGWQIVHEHLSRLPGG